MGIIDKTTHRLACPQCGVVERWTRDQLERIALAIRRNLRVNLHQTVFFWIR